MKIIVNEGQRALLYRNGRFVKLLGPGKHRYLRGGYVAQPMDVADAFEPTFGIVEQYVRLPEFRDALRSVEVPDGHVALHYANGRYAGLLARGLHAFWNVGTEHTFRLIDATSPEITGIPQEVLSKMHPSAQSIEVGAQHKGLLFFDGAFVRLLDEGRHWFWAGDLSGVSVRVDVVDMRLQQLLVQGQEVLSLDKAQVRANFVCRYRITDAVRAHTEFANHAEQLHVAAQLALREYIGRHRLDELMEDREQLSKRMFDALKRREGELFVEIVDAGVRDIILPGEVREIMNTVLVAEKKAQANVIARREEVASTRSLLNTAKLMEENRVLMRLKEMEHIEKICENVGSLTVNGGDLLSQILQGASKT